MVMRQKKPQAVNSTCRKRSINKKALQHLSGWLQQHLKNMNQLSKCDKTATAGTDRLPRGAQPGPPSCFIVYTIWPSERWNFVLLSFDIISQRKLKGILWTCRTFKLNCVIWISNICLNEIWLVADDEIAILWMNSVSKWWPLESTLICW